jgi:hypothetical protein
LFFLGQLSLKPKKAKDRDRASKPVGKQDLAHSGRYHSAYHAFGQILVSQKLCDFIPPLHCSSVGAARDRSLRIAAKEDVVPVSTDGDRSHRQVPPGVELSKRIEVRGSVVLASDYVG